MKDKDKNGGKELQIFNNPEFGEIRTTVIDGEPWFVGKDVATALGYSNTRDALSKHVDDEDKNTVAFRDGIQGNPNQTVINESGLYSLVLSSKLPTAKKFKRWVTSEVLPAIRKTGSYSVKQAEQDKTREMRAEAMLRNSISKQAKMGNAARQVAETQRHHTAPRRERRVRRGLRTQQPTQTCPELRVVRRLSSADRTKRFHELR